MSETHTNVTVYETRAQVIARKAKELYDALLAQGFSPDQATDLVGASIIGQREE